MSRKALQLVVHLEIQAVTCPGVWLCPSGNVQLLFSMLGREVQTKRLPPVFPLLFHERLTFQKTFASAGCLAEVQDALGREDVYAVLLQEVDDSSGGAAVQLARFHSNALNILYPSPCAKGLLAGVDVDLLMEASADYPGILCPKIELSTKTIVTEITSSTNDGYIINPRTLSSQKSIPPPRQNAQDIRTVHSDRKNYLPSNQRPQHRRRANQHRITINDPGVCRLTCPHRKQGSQSKFCGYPSGHVPGRSGFYDTTSECQELCQCEALHLTSKCPLCTQYTAIFSSNSNFPETVQEGRCQHGDSCSRNPGIANSFDKTKRLSKALHARVDQILQPTMNDLLHDREHFDPYIPFIQSQSTFNQKAAKYGPHHRGHAHDHVSQQFDAPFTQERACDVDPCSQASCGSGDEFNSHRQLFYANLEKFYRKLYDRAKNRAQENQFSCSKK